jgi:hypothetical protein
MGDSTSCGENKVAIAISGHSTPATLSRTHQERTVRVDLDPLSRRSLPGLDPLPWRRRFFAQELLPLQGMSTNSKQQLIQVQSAFTPVSFVPLRPLAPNERN